ncbi:MAG: TetR/AcrR family transcriptional regulator [Burkholderiales bacterium]|nr:TetR/AcrR family transcriptional regulator [Burkholderiales bacterium]
MVGCTSGQVNNYLSVDRKIYNGVPHVSNSTCLGQPIRTTVAINSFESILAAAKKTAQLHGYSGLNFRDLAADVGIKSSSIHYHFPTKADLGAAVARRYWEDSAKSLDVMAADVDAKRSLHNYPNEFRKSLANGNRLCLCSFMAAEYDDLPDVVKTEVQAFADVNIAWLRKMLVAAEVVPESESEARARAIFAAVAGAQLVARSRSDIALYDSMIDSYRAVGLFGALRRD